MPAGPPAEAVFQLVDGLFARLRIRALDLTEIAPPLDRNDVSAFLGVQVVLETLGALDARVRRNPLIADLLHRIAFLEKAGTGIRCMRDDARTRYIEPLLAAGWLEMTVPDKPRSSKQRYRVTATGLEALAESSQER